MNTQILRLAAGLTACAVPAWASATYLPTNETYSAAADTSTNFFSYDPAYTTPLVDITSTPGATAQISGSGYSASASTNLGSNHAYASVSTMPANVLSAGSFSGWYDQVTITGGNGAGTANFTLHLSGIVDVGAFPGGLNYTLGTSSLHPSQLTSTLPIFNISSSYSWPMDAVNPIATYSLGTSPYNDTSILFPETAYPTGPTGSGIDGIPSIPDPSLALGGDAGMGFPIPDLILTPGSGQSIDITLHGTLDFTYGEAFYLIGGLGVDVFGDGLESFCAFPFPVGDTCVAPVKDGSGPTTLDLSHSANLISIALPEGATASFASGNAYNVTTVPEPGTLFLIGAGLMGLNGFARRRIA